METTDSLSDDQFGIKVNALKLKRNVEMYQWSRVRPLQLESMFMMRSTLEQLKHQLHLIVMTMVQFL